MENQSVSQAYGVAGCLLCHQMDGNWELELVSLDWPHSFVMLVQSQYRMHDHFSLEGATWISPWGGSDDILAYGFSATWQRFVVAMSHTLYIFTPDRIT